MESQCAMTITFCLLLFEEDRGSIPRLATWISEIGYLPLPSRDMAEIPLKRRKSSIKPKPNQNLLLFAHCERDVKTCIDCSEWIPLIIQNYPHILLQLILKTGSYVRLPEVAPLHVKFESDCFKPAACIVPTRFIQRFYRQNAKLYLDLWPRDPKSIGFLLRSSKTSMWSLKVTGQKLCPQGLHIQCIESATA